MSAYIVIPARYGSTRFPGKPLARLAGKSLLAHVCDAARQVKDARVLVATDDDRILQHARAIDVEAVMTPSECSTGTDRVLAAVAKLDKKPDFIINLQGDSPLTPPKILQQMLDLLRTKPVVTPVVQLSWDMLDTLRDAKKITPFSGTLAIINPQDEALWFSKQVIPAMRDEIKMRADKQMSPVYQHLGIYGYSYAMLDKFAALPPSNYEKLEGLEQLRFLENGIKINVVKTDKATLNAWRGVDTPEDLAFVEQLLQAKT